MTVQVVMPQLGESVLEGTLTKWLKNVGDSVEEYEPLLEVNTDKVDTEVPSPASGTLTKILVEEGTTVTAGTVLAWIGEPGEKITEEPPPALQEPAVEENRTQVQPSAISQEMPSVGRDRELGFISPVVAKIASENQVDLHQVQGTGRGGRITKHDLLAYLESSTGSVGSPPPDVQRLEPVPAASLPGELMPHSTVRRAIAEHMVTSKRTSPHVTTIMEVDMSRVVAHRQANKSAFEKDGVKLTFTAYFIAATVAGLKAYPIVNSSWKEDGIQLHRHINIGMATSLGDEGLIVPVIKSADALSLLGIARSINDLAGRARAHQLKPDEVQGGTFTITNHGTSGSLFATPIINQPQCGILGVGAIQKRVVVLSDPTSGDTIAIRPMVYLSFTFDHRILDGAIADYFLAQVVESLQNW